MNKLIIYSLFLICLISKTAEAQSFTTRVGSPVMGKKDVLEVEYVADDVTIDQFRMPKFPNWILITGPNVSTTSIVTGNLLKKQTIVSVMLKPKMLGRQVIPGASALINNKSRTSNPAIVEVKNVDHISIAQSPAQQQPPASSLLDLFPSQDELPTGQYLQPGERAIDKIRDNIMIRLDLNKRSCYVGEPILATYKLCTRLRSKSKVVKQPMFSGSTVVELTNNEMTSHLEKINGLDYNVFVIRRVQLIPLNAGMLVLPSASVENSVAFYDASQLSSRDRFYGKAKVPVEEQTVTLQNKPETIEVKELPPFPAVGSAEFSGAVGLFDISISAGSEKMTTTSNNSLVLKITGVGNLQNVKAPAIAWPKGIEGFEPAEIIEYDKSSYPIIAVKTFTYPFVADKKGMYVIPAVHFNYFEPQSAQYQSKTTTSFALQIDQGTKKVFTTPSLTNVPAIENPWYIIIGAVVLLLLVGIFWYNTNRKSTPKTVVPPVVTTETNQNTATPGEDYIFKIREIEPVSKGQDFYKELCQLLKSFIKTKYNIDASQIHAYIQQHPEQTSLMLQLKELIDQCNLAMYTPLFDVQESLQHRLRAIEVLQKLEKQ